MTGTLDKDTEQEQHQRQNGVTAENKTAAPSNTNNTKKDDFIHGRPAWISGSVVIIPPILLLYLVFWVGVELQYKTFLVGFTFYLLNGMGITAGYHRLFSHRSFKATEGLSWVLAVLGAGSFQGSVKWWAKNHRAHHRYVDTDKDPYNALKGFFYSHVGWMLTLQDVEAYGIVDMADFKKDKVILLQHKYFWQIALCSGILAPAFICGLFWGDWAGGFTYAALAKLVYVHQTTFCINSLAHTDFLSKQTYSHNHSSFDSIILAILILGEGYHNFHHEFAADYRNGIKWYHWDPTKWFIRGAEMCGQAWDLVRFPNDVIEKNMYAVQLEDARSTLANATTQLAQIEKRLEKRTDEGVVMTTEEFEQRCSKATGGGNQKLVILDGYVLNLMKKIPTGPGYTHDGCDMDWYKNHPGGMGLMNARVGKDVTEDMNGGVYQHSSGALNLVQHLRIAKLQKN